VYPVSMSSGKCPPKCPNATIGDTDHGGDLGNRVHPARLVSAAQLEVADGLPGHGLTTIHDNTGVDCR
jgi:hypothetical protein